MQKVAIDMPWVVFYLQDEQFAVSVNHVKEMVAMPKVISVPQTPDYIRGVIDLRGQVIAVLDLRSKLGMKSLADETEDLIHLLAQREQDHKNWIAELASSVQEHREFELATDPHKCAFGKWYDHFRTDNRILARCLKKFDEPHQKIHAIADKVKAMEKNEDFEAALELIKATKENELAEMIHLFSMARTLLGESNREIALVLEWEDKTLAVGVDSIETVEKLSASGTEDLPAVAATRDNACITGIGKKGEKDALVQLIDVGKMIGQEKDLVFDLPGED